MITITHRDNIKKKKWAIDGKIGKGKIGYNYSFLIN